MNASTNASTPARKLRHCTDRNCPSYGELFHAEHASQCDCCQQLPAAHDALAPCASCGHSNLRPVPGQAVEVKFTDRNEVGYLLSLDPQTIRLATVVGTVERPVADIVKIVGW